METTSLTPPIKSFEIFHDPRCLKEKSTEEWGTTLSNSDNILQGNAPVFSLPPQYIALCHDEDSELKIAEESNSELHLFTDHLPEDTSASF